MFNGGLKPPYFKKKSMKPVNMAILAAAGAGLIYLLVRTKRNEGKNENKQTNNTIANNTLDSELAQQFYKDLKVDKTLGKYHVSLIERPTEQDINNLLNCANRVINLKGVQTAFTNLTGNQLNLNSVTAEILDSRLFTAFWYYAKAPKVVTINTTISINKKSILPLPVALKKDTIVGAYLGEQTIDNIRYYQVDTNLTVKDGKRGFFNSKIDGSVSAGKSLVPKDKCKIVTP